MIQFAIFLFSILLQQREIHGEMTCLRGYTPLYQIYHGMQSIKCCKNGIDQKNQSCLFHTHDYIVNCWQIFHTGRFDSCNCGLSCSGMVQLIDREHANCTGSCNCTDWCCERPNASCHTPPPTLPQPPTFPLFHSSLSIGLICFFVLSTFILFLVLFLLSYRKNLERENAHLYHL